MPILDLRAPGKLNATAKYAKSFTFILSTEPFDPRALEKGEEASGDQVVLKQEVPAERLGRAERKAVLPIPADFAKKIEDKEKADGSPIEKLHAYCVAAAEDGPHKLAQGYVLTIERARLELKAQANPPKLEFNFGKGASNVVEVSYEAINKPADVALNLSEGPAKIDGAPQVTKTPDKISGKVKVKFERPGTVTLTLKGTSAGVGGREEEREVELTAAGADPMLSITPSRAPLRVGEPSFITVAMAGLERTELGLDPAGVMTMQQKQVAAPGKVAVMPTAAGSVAVVAKGFIGASETLEERASVEVVQPSIKVVAEEKSIPIGTKLKISIEMEHCDGARLRFEPADRIAMDKAELKASDLVELTGKKDGKATLIVCGLLGATVKEYARVEFDSVGNQLAVDAYGYRPGNAPVIKLGGPGPAAGGPVVANVKLQV